MGLDIMPSGSIVRHSLGKDKLCGALRPCRKISNSSHPSSPPTEISAVEALLTQGFLALALIIIESMSRIPGSYDAD
jgi:hypothetical protein